jgi:hypothetical protein
VRHRRSAQAGLVPTRAMCSWHSVRAATELSADQVDSELKASVIKVAEAKVRGAKELSEVCPEAASRPMCDISARHLSTVTRISWSCVDAGKSDSSGRQL